MLQIEKTKAELDVIKTNLADKREKDGMCYTRKFQKKRLILEKKSTLNIVKNIQLCRLEMAPLLNKYYRNEVTLTGQNLLLKFCLPLELFIQF